MRRFLLSFITIIIIPLTIVISILWISYFTLLSPHHLKKVVNSTHGYSEVIAILPNYLKQNEGTTTIFNKEEKSRIIEAAVSENYLKTNIEKIIDNFYAWINNKKDSFSYSVDLSSLKDEAKSEITAIYKEKYAALPECTEDELLLAKIQDENQFPTCRIPSESQFDSIYKNFDTSLVTTDALNSLPDKIEIPLAKNWENLPNLFHLFRLFLNILTLVVAILFGLCLYLLHTYPKKLVRYIGIFSLIIGAGLLSFKLLAFEIINNGLLDSLNHSLQDSQDLKTLLVPIYHQLVNDLKNNFHQVALLLIGVGILCLIAKFFIREKQPAKFEEIKPNAKNSSDVLPQKKNQTALNDTVRPTYKSRQIR